MQADVSEILAFAHLAEREADRMADALVKAVTEAGEVGARVARAAAPVRTGALRDSIDTRVTGSGKTDAGVRSTIRANVAYSWLVNAGTARQRPQPFMDRGAEAAEPVLMKRLEKAADKAFD